MKKLQLLFILICGFISTHSFSNELKSYITTSFNGSEAYSKCETAKNKIEDVFEKYKETGVKIVSAECEKVTLIKDVESYRVNVLYSDSLTFKIESYLGYYNNETECLDAQKQFQRIDSDFSFLFNHCSGNQGRYTLRLDYVDQRKLTIEKYLISEIFTEKESCESVLPELLDSFQKNDYQVLVAQCLTSKSGRSEKDVFRHQVLYTRIFDKFYLVTIDGESYLEASQCQASLPDVNARLQKAGTPVLHSFCESVSDKRWNHRLTIKENIYSSVLKDFKSQNSYETKELCEIALEAFVKQLDKTTDFNVVYPFCRMVYSKWGYQVYYKPQK